MLNHPTGQFIDSTLQIRGVGISLRFFPGNNAFAFSTSRPLSEREKHIFVNYMKLEGFLDNPLTGDSATSASF